MNKTFNVTELEPKSLECGPDRRRLNTASLQKFYTYKILLSKLCKFQKLYTIVTIKLHSKY